MKINIHLDDSLKAMESMPDKKYGLAIVDPPYGKKPHRDDNGTYGAPRTRKFLSRSTEWDIRPTQLYFDELLRISNYAIIWGCNYFIDYLHPTNSIIVWDKKTGANMFADCEIAWSNHTSNIKKFEMLWLGSHCHRIEKLIHPTQKPVKLYKWLLKNYGFNKDGSKRTIFDSHGGSLSIVLACIDMGFDIDIWEIDPDYYRDGVNRVKRHLAQLDLTRETVEINIK